MGSSAKGIPLFIIIPFVVIGPLFALFGAVNIWSAWNTRSSAHRTDGTVVELVRVDGPMTPGAKGKPPVKTSGFAPVVEYQVAGQSYRIRGNVSSSKPSYAVGEVVGILYSPDDPSGGTIASFSEQWLAPLLFGGIGLLFTLIGFGMLWARIRSRGTQAAEPDVANGGAPS